MREIVTFFTLTIFFAAVAFHSTLHRRSRLLLPLLESSSKGSSFEEYAIETLYQLDNIPCHRLGLEKEKRESSSWVVANTGTSRIAFDDVQQVRYDETISNSLFWCPTWNIPAIDFLITSGKQIWLFSVTVSKDHAIVIKCPTGKNSFGGLLPLMSALKMNGFDTDCVPFIWVVPGGEMGQRWKDSRPRALHQGVEWMTKEERRRIDKLNVPQSVSILDWTV
jgi:hypothetical protein